MKGYGNCDRGPLNPFLHDPVAPALARQHKIMLFENPAHFQA
jgi:hypothetical protein